MNWNELIREFLITVTFLAMFFAALLALTHAFGVAG